MAVDPVAGGELWRAPAGLRARHLFLTIVLFAAGLSSASAVDDAGEWIAFACGGCHGHTGVSAADSMPSIAGFDRRYLARVLREFKTGVRHSTIMGRLMAGYSLQDIALLASYYAEQSWEGSGIRADAATIARGREIHEAGCEQCHEDGGRVQDRDMPRLAGQQPEYLRIQMLLRRAGTEGMQQPNRMREALLALSDEDIFVLSRFLASQD
jgi:cytochrome subunit of sulfide dehydrogenase